MQLTLIGTSAGEGYPGFWCECPNCTKARKLGGRNRRGNCCAMLDTDVLIDMNAHFFEAAPRMGIKPSLIQTLLVTHPHPDHFIPRYLLQRALPVDYISAPDKERLISPNFTELPWLQIYGNEYVHQAMEHTEGLLERAELCRFAFHPITEGREERSQNLHILPIASHHTDLQGFAHNYILTREKKTLLYATDTGGYDPDMLDLIFSHTYDCVVMEGTFGLGAEAEGHMCLPKNIAMKKELEKHNCLKPGCGFYLTHICPHWSPPYDEYASIVAGEGMILGYDGQIIEI